MMTFLDCKVCSGSVCHGHALHLKARGFRVSFSIDFFSYPVVMVGGSPGFKGYFPMKKWRVVISHEKKSGMRGIFLLYLEAQNPEKKIHNTSNKIQAAISSLDWGRMSPLSSCWCCPTTSGILSGEVLSQLGRKWHKSFQRGLASKTSQNLTGFFRRFFLLKNLQVC